jgi:hypothetical protein
MQQQPPECRIITVQQPWADLLVPDAGVIERIREVNPDLAARLPKDVENRPRGANWRGPLLILAGLQVDQDAMDRFDLNRNHFIRGVVVGVVDLDDVVTDSTSTWAVDGATHWLVSNPIRLLSPPIATGSQGIRLPEQRLHVEVYARLDQQRIALGG